jgi:hypothetical protein
MGTGDAAGLYEENGKRVVILDRKDLPRWHPIFNGNRKLVEPREIVGCGGYSDEFNYLKCGPGRRPYADYTAIERLGRRLAPRAQSTKELRRAASRLCFVYDYKVRPGEVHFTDKEQDFAARVAKEVGAFHVIEPNIKGRVPAKQWGVKRWQALADMMHRRGIQPVQLGPGAGTQLNGVRNIRTPDFRAGLAVMQHAASFVVPEGGLHHGFGALGKKGVALFAGRTPLTLAYAPQTTWFVQHPGGDREGWGCGVEHVDCSECRKLWQALRPEQVFEMLAACL